MKSPFDTTGQQLYRREHWPDARAWVRRAGGVLALGLVACTGTMPPPAAGNDESKAQITVLYDAFGKSSSMRKDWGFSAFIEYRGKRVLFDTGNNAEVLAQNVRAKGIDLTRLDFVVMSHRHGDHIGGLNYVLSVNPNVPIYAPKENFGVFGAALPGTFYRQDPSLPAEMRYFDGQPPKTLNFGTPWPQGKFTWVAQAMDAAPGFHLLVLKGSWGVDLDVMEVSLAIDTPQGTVLVVGCSHPTIEKIVEAATTALGKPVHLVIGGTHLLPAKDDETRRVATALRDTWKVNYIAPVHCTGEPAFGILKSSFGDHYVYAGLGTTVMLDATVTTVAERGQPNMSGMDEQDLGIYQTLMADSDDNPGRIYANGHVEHRRLIAQTRP